MKQCLAALLVLACVISTAAPALSSPPATALPQLLFVQARTIGHLKALQQRKAAVERLFDQYFDFAAFSQLVLQDHWQGLSEAERAEFLGRFRKVLVDRISAEIPKLNRQRFSLGLAQDVQIDGRPAVTVPVRNRKGTATLTLWLLPKAEAASICDLMVDDVLLSRQYRGQFNRIIRKQGFAELLSRLERVEVNHAEAKR